MLFITRASPLNVVATALPLPAYYRQRRWSHRHSMCDHTVQHIHHYAKSYDNDLSLSSLRGRPTELFVLNSSSDFDKIWPLPDRNAVVSVSTVSGKFGAKVFFLELSGVSRASAWWGTTAQDCVDEPRAGQAKGWFEKRNRALNGRLDAFVTDKVFLSK